MLNIKKKVIFINGTVLMPLRIKKCAIIYHNGRKTITPAVISVKKVSKKIIIFETLNAIYCVIPELAPKTRFIDAPVPVCA